MARFRAEARPWATRPEIRLKYYKQRTSIRWQSSMGQSDHCCTDGWGTWSDERIG